MLFGWRAQAWQKHLKCIVCQNVLSRNECQSLEKIAKPPPQNKTSEKKKFFSDRKCTTLTRSVKKYHKSTVPIISAELKYNIVNLVSKTKTLAGSCTKPDFIGGLQRQ